MDGRNINAQHASTYTGVVIASYTHNMHSTVEDKCTHYPLCIMSMHGTHAGDELIPANIPLTVVCYRFVGK